MKNKWIDKDGNIYLIYSRKEAQKMLKLSDKPITKAFKNLKKLNLFMKLEVVLEKIILFMLAK